MTIKKMNLDAVAKAIEADAGEALPDLLQACDLFVGNNSGPHHIAAALGVPTVGVHSGVVDAIEWGPLGPFAIAIRRDMNCMPCYLDKVVDCHRGLACLRGLSPGDVYRACRPLLALMRLRVAATQVDIALDEENYERHGFSH